MAGGTNLDRPLNHNKMNTRTDKRIYGVDLLKIIACCGVVALHTLNGELSIINRVITLVCTVCIPLFFISSGYVMFVKNQVTCKYAFSKILRILSVCFLWEMLHAIAFYIYYREVRNFLYSLLMDFVQKGLFFHFWYLGALGILYLILPILSKMKKNKPLLFVVAWCLFGFISCVIDIFSIALRSQIELQIIQTFRLWIWLYYYMAGAILVMNKKQIDYFFKDHYKEKVFGVIVFIVIWQLLIGRQRYGVFAVEGFHGSMPIMIGSLIIFYVFEQMKLRDITIKIVKQLSPLIMGVYIVHPFILATLVHFVPAFQSNSICNLLYWLLTIGISFATSKIISLIPGMKELIRL